MEYFLGLNSETNFDFECFDKFSGVGMIRGENLCINKMQYFTKKDFCDYVTKYLDYVSKIFVEKEVWYRTADLVPHQINLLDGCDKQIDESQYLIGLRGVRRDLAFVSTFKMELEAFLKAYKENKNLSLLIPFVSSVSEIKKVKLLLNEMNYDGKLGIMIEIPSVIFMLEEFNELGIDNYTIGLNDLTSTILGAKRDLDIYSINDPAVRKAIIYIVNKIHQFGKTVTVAGYLNREMLEFVENIGVDYVNIHYNEIPLLLNNIADEGFYVQHYNSIKQNYKAIKRIRKIND